MAEIIADLPYQVVDTEGRQFYVNVAGRARADGTWEGWLEYVPLDDSEPLITPTETTQPNRANLLHWADALSDTYVQGAYRRAVLIDVASELDTAESVSPPYAVRRHVPAAVVGASSDLPDPFELFNGGVEVMRARLNALPRAMLLDIIAGFGLNPAGKSLAWLTDRQLVTFIITAVEAQLAMRRRSPSS